MEIVKTIIKMVDEKNPDIDVSVGIDLTQDKVCFVLEGMGDYSNQKVFYSISELLIHCKKSKGFTPVFTPSKRSAWVTEGDYSADEYFICALAELTSEGWVLTYELYWGGEESYYPEEFPTMRSARDARAELNG